MAFIGCGLTAGMILKGALCAFAANVFNDSFEVFLTVIVNNFFAWLDNLSRPNPDSVARYERFRIRRTRMIGIAGQIIAAAAVNRPFLVHPKKVLAITFLDNVVRHARTGVFDDLLAFRNALGREQSEAGG